MIAAGAALATALSGNGMLLLAASDTAGPGITPWLQGGGSAAAVAGLVYVARMIVKGDLVPRAVAERENETNAALAATVRREQEAIGLAREGHEREQTLGAIARESVGAVADNTAELRWWRDQRERGVTVALPRRDTGSKT